MKKFICLIVAFAWLSVDAQQDWELIHGSDSLRVFECIFMTDTEHIWGAGEGFISVSHDGGYQWEIQFDEYDYYFKDLFFIDSFTGWAIGWGHVMKTIDGGENWDFQSLPNPWGLDVESVFFLNPDTGWIAGSYQTIYGTLDGGETWVKQNNTQIEGSYWFFDIHFFDASHGCAVGGTFENPTLPIIFTTNNGGNDWTEIFLQGNEWLEQVQFTDELTVWSCDNYGKIYRSIDGGYNWGLAQTVPYIYPGDMHFFNETSAILAGSGGFALSPDGWGTWQHINVGYTSYIRKISFPDNLLGMACGYENLFRTFNGGLTWQRLNDRFSQMEFFGPQNGWIIQEQPNNNLMHSTDGGFTWSEVGLAYSGTFIKMSFPSETVGFILSDQSDLLKSIDAGTTWEIIDLPFDSASLSGMQFIDENIGFIYAHSNQLYKTINGGQDWETFTIDSLQYITGVEFLDVMEGWVIGSDGSLAHTINGGETWIISTITTYSLSGIEFVNPQLGFIISRNSGQVFRTNNGGEYWEELGIDVMMPSDIAFASPEQGWITDSYGLFFTLDGGDNWVKILDAHSANNYASITGLSVLDTNLAWICTMDGRVFSCSDIVGIGEDNGNQAINIFPNPVKDQLHIDFYDPGKKYFNLRIFSVEGKLLLAKDLAEFKEEKIDLDLSGFPAGIYFLNIQGATVSESFKVVKH